VFIENSLLKNISLPEWRQQNRGSLPSKDINPVQIKLPERVSCHDNGTIVWE
jgi:hypothetical protein